MSSSHRLALSFLAVFIMMTVLFLDLSNDSPSPPHSPVLRKRQDPTSSSSSSQSASTEPSTSTQSPLSTDSASVTTATDVTDSESSTGQVSTSTTTEPSTTSSEVTTTSETTTSTSTSLSTSTSTTAPTIPTFTSTSTSTSSSTTTSSPSPILNTRPATTLIVDPVTSTVIPTETQPSISVSATPSPAGGAATSFWDNQKAVGATFSVVGLIGAGVLGVIAFTLIRKRRFRKQFEARDTIVWSDKAADPELRPGSPTIDDLAQQAPLDAYQSRDPFYGSSPITHAPYRPYISETSREPSVYSQNLAGYGSGMTPGGYAQAQDYSQAPSSSYGLAPPPSLQPSAGQLPRSSFDSFYAGYSTHDDSAGRAL